MRIITGNKHYNLLHNTYFGENYEKSPSQYYKDWVEHKFTHSIKVAQAGVMIIDDTTELKESDKNVKDDFVSALILHDLARAFERDWQTGEKIKMDHAVKGAQEIVKEGEESLNIILPVMVHNKFNEGFLEYNNEDLTNEREYHWLLEDERLFVEEYRSKYFALNDEQKRSVMRGCYLVKDADKIDNLINADDMIVLNRAPKVPVVNEEVLKQFYNRQMVRLDARINFIDHVFCWLSWIYNLNYDASKKILLKFDALENMKRHAIAAHDNIDEKDRIYLENVMDKAISFLDI